MKITYESGKSFDDSYFVAKEGDQEIKVKASQIVPLDIQEKIKVGDKQVISVEEAIEQMQGEHSSVEDFQKFARKAALKNRVAARKLKRKANYDNWSINQSELPKDINKQVKEPEQAIDPKEAAADKKQHPVKTTSSPATKKYYGRLPSSSIGSRPEVALDVKSSKKVVALTEKIKTQASEIEELKAKLTEKEGTLVEEKNKNERKAKSEKVDRVIELLSKKGNLNIEEEIEREEAIKKYSTMEASGLDLFIEMLEKNDSESEQNVERKASLENTNYIPGSFAGETKVQNDVETMSDIWDR